MKTVDDNGSIIIKVIVIPVVMGIEIKALLFQDNFVKQWLF